MSPQVVAAVIAASVSFLTLIGTLAAQYFGRRATSRDTQKALEEQGKQLDRKLAEQRTRTLNERFATAAGQLGDDKPPAVRLAGVYAMAGLADDWRGNRQTCVDVLCAYLRMPYQPDPGKDASVEKRLDFRANREVRHTVIRVITAHLLDDAAVSWQGLTFDFWGVVFDGGDFRGAKFSGGTVSFHGARFSGGTVWFSGAEFSGGAVSFHGAEFSGVEVSFSGADFSGGTVDFTAATFSHGEVSFRGAKFSGGEVSFGVPWDSTRFSGCEVSFYGGRFSGGRVNFSAEFSGGRVNFSAEFSGGRVNFSAEFSGGRVNFMSAKFSGGTVEFLGSSFSGGKVSFSHAEFSGGTVDFGPTADWSVPPEFPWTGTPPSERDAPQGRRLIPDVGL
jgi:uncharacterized protein YjbI with pentapeptide repeats